MGARSASLNRPPTNLTSQPLKPHRSLLVSLFLFPPGPSLQRLLAIPRRWSRSPSRPPAAPSIPRLTRHVTAPALQEPGNCHQSGGARGASAYPPLAARRSARGSAAAPALATRTAWASAPRNSPRGKRRPARGDCGRTYSTRILGTARARSRGRPGGRARAPGGCSRGPGALREATGPGGAAWSRQRLSIWPWQARAGVLSGRCGPALLYSAATWKLSCAEKELCLGFPSCITTRQGRWISVMAFSPEVLRLCK